MTCRLSAIDALCALSTTIFPTGISYADRTREKDVDYLKLAFLPFSTLKLEWRAERVRNALRALIEADAAKIIARRGEYFVVSATPNGQTVKLGG